MKLKARFWLLWFTVQRAPSVTFKPTMFEGGFVQGFYCPTPATKPASITRVHDPAKANHGFRSAIDPVTVTAVDLRSIEVGHDPVDIIPTLNGEYM